MGARTDRVIGSRFLDYRVEELVGQGGMGLVYRAHDGRLERKVALKLVAPELARDERFRERFLRESQLAASLEHPNVVPVHDAGERDGQLYLAMRYVEGSDLRAVLRAEGALEPARALAICAQVADALDAAHARGLVHRDVKPSNVLLDAGERAYLADFGLSRRLAEQGAPFVDAHSLGTPAYVAPEQIERAPVDGRADVYSLGCLLFECLTGEPPFVRDSRLGIVWAHLEDEAPRASARNAALPEAVDAVFRKALAKEPGERYATCSELVAAARDALGLAAPSPRRAFLPLVAALVALLAIAAAAASVFLARDGTEATKPLLPRTNSVVRIDPATNEIAAVIDVGGNPIAVAAAGRTVWAYNADDETVSEIDAPTNRVRRTVRLAAPPVLPRAPYAAWTGPLLAADAGGAWIPGVDFERSLVALTRIRSGGGRREYRVRVAPTAVAVGGGAVWLLARDLRGPTVVRVSPTTGAVVDRVPLRTAREATGIAYGEGAVWVSGWSTGTVSRWNAIVLRIDAASSAVTGTVPVVTRGSFSEAAMPPTVGLGAVWVGASTAGGTLLRVAPRRLREVEATTAPFRRSHRFRRRRPRCAVVERRDRRNRRAPERAGEGRGDRPRDAAGAGRPSLVDGARRRRGRRLDDRRPRSARTGDRLTLGHRAAPPQRGSAVPKPAQSVHSDARRRCFGRYSSRSLPLLRPSSPPGTLGRPSRRRSSSTSSSWSAAPTARPRTSRAATPTRPRAAHACASFVSDGYDVDEVQRVRWAQLLDSLVHGPELEQVTLHLAPEGELHDRCGGHALACYMTGTRTILATGAGEAGGISAEALVMHEYGHHVARSRLNPPWGALSDGTKRWASYMGICKGVRSRIFFPQISFGPLYRLNPAEGFAEAYRVLNERRLGLAEAPWSLVDRRFYPDPTALRLLEQDVLEPWRGNTTLTRAGRGSRAFRIATPLDGKLRVSVAARSGTVYRVSAPTSVCGQRSVVVRVRHVRGGGAFRLTVSRP